MDDLIRPPEAEERYPAYRRGPEERADFPHLSDWRVPEQPAPDWNSHDQPLYPPPYPYPYPYPAAEPPPPPKPRRRSRIWRWFVRGVAAFIVLFVIAVGWLAFTAPLSKSLQPPTPPSITLDYNDGHTPIARRGAVVGAPVDASKLPPYVPQAFIAIEDRRFYHHWGVDPRAVLRALWQNVRSGTVREGGSTITQQLAKNAFLDNGRTAGRKLREVLIAFWLEAWLSKNEILSRYLSNVYFGDNVYGLTAAARHYFNRTPQQLTVGQAAMLAGLVKAPSRLAPTGNLEGAQAREAVVVKAMREVGYLTARQAAAVHPAQVRHEAGSTLPNGTYFADWVLPTARDEAGEIHEQTTVRTTLDQRMQRAAERAVRGLGLRHAQVALVAMRPDGRVVAMVGGKNYGESPFNRVTQARRQPGSAFKLFVYLAALRSGLTPDSTVEDSPVTIAGWSPRNADGHYRGRITLREAFARSSNVAAARLTQQVGVDNVIKAARDLGISTPIPNQPGIALGTSTVSLLELTGAFAAIAHADYPVQARGLENIEDKSWYSSWTSPTHSLDGHLRDEMLELLAASVNSGTSREAALSINTYGKTGTTQDSRDALFLGFAGDLVCGVWVGNDDNTPNPGLSGGGVPARLWRAFMTEALGVRARERPHPVAPVSDQQIDPDALPPADPGDGEAGDGVQKQPFTGDYQGLGLNLHIGQDGSIRLNRAPSPSAPPPPRETRQRPPERGGDEE